MGLLMTWQLATLYWAHRSTFVGWESRLNPPSILQARCPVTATCPRCTSRTYVHLQGGHGNAFGKGGFAAVIKWKVSDLDPPLGPHIYWQMSYGESYRLQKTTQRWGERWWWLLKATRSYKEACQRFSHNFRRQEATLPTLEPRVAVVHSTAG